MGLTCCRRALPLVIGLVLSGCGAADDPRDPDITERQGFEWKQVGETAEGCPRYTKEPTRDDVIVDQAIYYRTADGDYTTDRTKCAASQTGDES